MEEMGGEIGVAGGGCGGDNGVSRSAFVRRLGCKGRSSWQG